ncbi:hypothetical protein [Salinibacillus xinjiangensis]|uniref:hypothetical protein n=1 Tax=Salinibacillus xinjiangensis TaxID=1229268 RepID=UPI00129B7930|nr:hypothetical protein [Salinibacillus xinjiangensis]
MHQTLPELESFPLKDNTRMYYRHFPSNTNVVLILVHGIAEDHKYLRPQPSI